LFRFLFTTFFFVNFLIAQEPSLALLKTVYNNGFLVLEDNMQKLTCKPYGIYTLEDLFFNPKENKSCQKAIVNFYNENKALEYFALNSLHVNQMYHYEMRNNRCILYVKGEMTYAEVLLKQGLAYVRQNMTDNEFKYSFFKIEKNARYKRTGLWKTTIPFICQASQY
jgi:hypothetical protein